MERLSGCELAAMPTCSSTSLGASAWLAVDEGEHAGELRGLRYILDSSAPGWEGGGDGLLVELGASADA